MKRFAILMVLWSSIALAQTQTQLSAPPPAEAPATAASYPAMAPLDRYLMDRTAELALAQSAAPPQIAREAEVLVLGRHGYEVAVKGRNGFVCVVERAWMSPFDDPGFWNPRLRGPVCYNAAGARSVLPYTIKRTALVLAGMNKDQLLAAVKSAVAQHQLPVPEAGEMSFMMSKNGYLGDQAGGPWHSHVMISIPRTDAAMSDANAALWGANVPNSPVVANTRYTEMPEPETIFFVPVDHWSDGTPAPIMHH